VFGEVKELGSRLTNQLPASLPSVETAPALKAPSETVERIADQIGVMSEELGVADAKIAVSPPPVDTKKRV